MDKSKTHWPSLARARGALPSPRTPSGEALATPRCSGCRPWRGASSASTPSCVTWNSPRRWTPEPRLEAPRRRRLEAPRSVEALPVEAPRVEAPPASTGDTTLENLRSLWLKVPKRCFQCRCFTAEALPMKVLHCGGASNEGASLRRRFQ